MSLESEFFKRSRMVPGKLEAFGFKREAERWEYGELLPDCQFRAELFVTESGQVTGRVMDLDTDEEYLPIRVQDQNGAFVGKVREEYLEFLGRVEAACFVPVDYIYDQANRINRWILEEIGVTVEFPWEKYPGNGAYKYPGNGKWFGLILTVAYGKLQGAEKDRHEAEKIVEVINLKADPAQVPKLTAGSGVYPAWHMNKKHWISVILDETLPDEEIRELIRRSYQMIVGAKGAAAAGGTGAWMIPSKPGVYDVDAGFRDGGGIIEWHQHNKVKAGDEVFLYCSAPYSAILYRCEVVEADLPYRGMFRESKGYQKAMRIRLLEKYPPDKYPLSFIKAHGGSVVRSARSMPKDLYQAIQVHK